MRDFTDDLRDVRRRLDEASEYLKVADSRDRLVELEAEISRPDLWDDAERGKQVNTDYANVKSDVDLYDELSQQLDDAEVLHELAREVDDETQEPEIEGADHLDRQAARPARAAQPVHRRARRLRLHRADQRQGRRRRRPGLRPDAAADVRPLGRAQGLRDRAQLRDGGRRSGHQRRRVHAHRPLRVRPDDERARHAPAGADQPVRQSGPAPDELRRRAGVAGHGRPERRDRRSRHPHGGLPCVGRRRPAHQQDVLRRAADPRADRPRRPARRRNAASSRTGNGR